MSKLQAALAWAARGFRVFPLEENGKEPAHGATWYETATTDADVIRRTWTNTVLGTERDYNIGVDCTDMVVFDIDVKNGKDGIASYAAMGGHYDSLVVKTPSGGYHVYFDGPDSANTQDKKGNPTGVDIRSHHGYVVAPGSTIDGKAYEVVRDMRPVWVPLSLERHLKDPFERKEGAITEALDSPASIEAGKRYLESAPVAIEGQRGDETTFITAARLVREMALSVVTAYQLMVEHWNERCIPPWSLDELYQKVENAAQYGTADLGRLDPAVLFRTVSVEPPPSVFAQNGVSFGNGMAITDIQPRPWLVDRLLMLREQTLLIAPGAAGKSSLSLALTAHVVMGRDFGPFKLRSQGKHKAVVYNGEDDKQEQCRRLYAVCDLYGFDYEEVRSRIMVLGEEDIDLKLVGTTGRAAVANEALVRQLIELTSDPEIVMMTYDPLVDIHEVDENDNPQMNAVLKVLKRIAREANIASLIVHHTAKVSSKQEDRIGNVDIARGAGGIANKVRIAFTLLNASQTDAEEYGLQPQERRAWVRLDDAKMSFAAHDDNAVWFRKEGVRIPSGDIVGVVKYAQLTKSVNHIKTRIAEHLIGNMVATGMGSMNMAQACAYLAVEEPLWANKTQAEMRKQLEGMFITAFEVRGTTLKATRGNDGKGEVIFTIT